MAKAKQPGIPISALQSRLAQGKIASVHLIAGPEHFLADEAVRSIADAIRATSGDCARSFYRGDEAELATVLDDVRTRNLFSPKRLVVVSPADGFVQEHSAALAKFVAAPPAGGFLVLVASKVDGRLKLAKDLEKLGGLVNCARLYQRDIVTWIMARVRAMNRQLDSAAAALLADFLGTDLGALAAELEKLAAYVADRKRITADDVEAVSLRDRTRSIFELTDAVGRRQTGQALAILNGLLDQGERASGILFMVSRHMRRLWAAKELIEQGRDPLAAAHAVGVFHFVEQFLGQARAFTIRDLRRHCAALVRCEARLKTSRMSDRILLETTFIRLTQPPQRAAPD